MHRSRPLLKPEIEKAVRFAKRTVHGLVVVLARPPLRIAKRKTRARKCSLGAQQSVLLLGP